MSQEDILRDLRQVSIRHTRVSGKYFFVVRHEDFEPYEQYFVRRKNIFDRKVHLRTSKQFQHIHAIHGKTFVEFHVDYGNAYENPLLAVTHFFIDVLPYCAYYLFKREGFYHRIAEDETIDPRAMKQQ